MPGAQQSGAMSTDKQIEANRANALLSTGPTSPEGKAKSSLNAVKTGLTGRTVLLPSEDAALYTAHLERFFKRFSPVGDDEANLVQSIADTEWRLLRIPGLELGIFALGHLEFAEKFANHDESLRKSLIDAQIYVTYQRQLANLSIQQGRLSRQRERDIAALEKLQQQRKEAHGRQIADAKEMLELAAEKGLTINLADFGFEISEADIAREQSRLKYRKQGYSHANASRMANYAA
jgi:hypothetical protein